MSLVGRYVRAVHTFECHTVHPAWVSELTTPVVTSRAFLEFMDGELAAVYPCEVEIDQQKYPSLGLTLERCTRGAMKLALPNGESASAHPLAAVTSILPLLIAKVEQSDPLQEGAVSEFRLCGEASSFIVFRHIMPPITLGISFGVAP